jgi:hypothetical protein
MSSRTPRRAFAASFVITMAALPACRVQTVDHRAAPPPPPADTTGGDTVDHRNDPPPPPDNGGGDTVDHRNDGHADPNQDTVDHRGASADQTGGTADPTGPMRPGPVQADVPAGTELSWVLVKQGDGTCVAAVETHCAPGHPGSCNPPAPRPYACPANLTITADRPIHIVKPAASTECILRIDAAPCHPGATCNPPPPRKAACPG